MKQSHRSLICVNTCNRLLNVKAMVWDFAAFCARNRGYDFVLALDGNNREYLNYANRYGLPIIYSQAREGVCLSKNRVLKQFAETDYDYVFFLDDDAQLLDSRVFDIHIEVSRVAGIHHLILGQRARQRAVQGFSSAAGYRIEHAMYGTGQFTFYTCEGLKRVGGFHTEFGRYRRFGHTEHSYRFVNAGLQAYPFNMILECEPMLRWFDPPSVTSTVVARDPESRLALVEMDIIRQRLTHLPLQTMAPFRYLAGDASKMKLDDRVAVGRWYQRVFPLLIWAERLPALVRRGGNALRKFLRTTLSPGVDASEADTRAR
jgi:hypothetical protein